ELTPPILPHTLEAVSFLPTGGSRPFRPANHLPLPGRSPGGFAGTFERSKTVLNLWGSRQGNTCDGSTRRDFLKVGALGLGGFLLPDLLRARAAARQAGKPTKNTSVVWLWLAGGPTHVETFDPKMTAPAEFRSVVGAAKTNLPGVE